MEAIPPPPQPHDFAQERIARLFRFVAALHARRNPPVRQVGEHDWVIRPKIDARTTESDTDDKTIDDEQILLRCRRESGTITDGIFEQLQEIYATLARDGEQFELVVADGILLWRRPEGNVRHPLLSRVVRLEFRPEIPEFLVVESGASTEFASSLFRSMEDIDDRTIRQLQDEAETLDPHPWGTSETEAFLRTVAARLSSRGVFMPTGLLPVECDHPIIGRDPLLLLRRRISGTARAIDAVIEDVLRSTSFPTSLLNIVGIPTPQATCEDTDADETVLFTKPANTEQRDIARSLERNDCVLVQGPPGTGKTHTIANLLGHLLAQGKSVLVVSHTTKALRVLRDQVVPQLQPLCAAVLDSSEDDATLSDAVIGIVERSGAADLGPLDREVARLETERGTLIADIRAMEAALLASRLDEQRPIRVGDEETAPIDAAKEVAAGTGVHDWIPSPITPGAALPLNIGELSALYATNASLSVEDERVLADPLPQIIKFPEPERFAHILAEQRDLKKADLMYRIDLWEQRTNRHDVETLDEALSAAQRTLRVRDDLPAWARRLINAGADNHERRSWDALLADIENAYNDATASRELLLAHGPQISQALPRDRVADVYTAIAKKVRSTGKKPTFLTLMTRREWKTAIKGSYIGADVKPRLPEHFEALAAAARVLEKREALRRRWVLQVEKIGGPSASDLGTEVEASCRRYVPLIVSALDWNARSWGPIVQRLIGCGLHWETLSAQADARFPEEDDIGRIARLVEGDLPLIFAAERARRRLRTLEHELTVFAAAAKTERSSPPCDALRHALAARDPERYHAAYREVERLRAATEHMRRRDDLLTRLESAAPAWAAHIRARVDRHGTATVPNDIPAAWRRRQFEDALRRREAASLSDIMLTLEQRREALADATTELVVRKAWQAQALRTSLEQRQALVGFADAKKRLGRGTGKRAAAFARTARECMIKARSAVPVWIMPTVKAAETFDPRSTRFDVVIVDEASQSDVTGLIALYLGKQVIVVGDDEQVSPSAVGEKAPAAQHLIDAFLTDIPNAQLYDGKQSLYDIAKASFGGTICLLEHFRCVPDIIRFSNELCYEGRMKPLREPQPNNPVPAVVAHRVTSSGTIGKINHDEARTVTALVAAVIDQPEYIDKSIGIISLVGNEQACLIEELLRGILAPTEIQARRLLCGGATHFQGDERDIMFLSVVDAGKGASLQLRRDRAFRQRLNVAASRARDQMWVVHSLDPSELKNGDLRRALLTHAMNPSAPENEGAEPTREVSPFEAEILQRLTAAGFRVQTHRRVGAYRAGIVVTGERGRRLVVECEGDRLYRAEELAHDAERQTVLERLGWKFAHIRAGNFYRSPEEAMRSIFQRLQTLGIPPLPTEPEARRSDIADELLSRIGARAAEILASL